LIHLHVRSWYSFLAGGSSPEELAYQASRLGQSALALTDLHGFYGAVKFAKACKKYGIRPIFGVTLLVSPHQPSPNLPETLGPLVFLARNLQDYATICDLVTLAHDNQIQRNAPTPHLYIDQIEAFFQAKHAAYTLEGVCTDTVLSDANSPTSRGGAKPNSLQTLSGVKGPGALPLVPLVSGGREGWLDELVIARKKAEAQQWIQRLKNLFGTGLHIELSPSGRPGDRYRLETLAELAQNNGIPTIISNDVRFATTDHFARYDALTCVRLGIDITQTHPQRPVNDRNYLCGAQDFFEHLPPQSPLHEVFHRAIENTQRLALQCQLELLPDEVTPPSARLPQGTDPESYLQHLCAQGFQKRYSKHSPEQQQAAQRQLDKEMAVITQLELCEFFLVVWEVIEFARQRKIRCAGRGSAANSIIAYLLGITSVDPLAHRLLFERFLHRGRKGMPDIDVDFDSNRRPEVIAWMEERFQAQHCAMTATLQTYQIRGALRDMMKVLGWDPQTIDRCSQIFGHWESLTTFRQKRQEMIDILAGSRIDTPGGAEQIQPKKGTASGTRGPRLSPGQPVGAEQIQAYSGTTSGTYPAVSGGGGGSPLVIALCALVEGLIGCPRHLGLHNGGVVLTRKPLANYSPIQTSAGGYRQLQFDKDDVEALGLIKFDVLGLRMLGALSEAEQLIQEHLQPDFDLETIVDGDSETYDLICSGETMGLFQIESPGQVSLLSRTQPRCFNDLVIQVALFRPGPLQGGMVNPYLLRRTGQQQVTYLHPTLKNILEDTHGIVVFQEQILEICHQFAGLSLDEADEFRRIMSKWRDPGNLDNMGLDFIEKAVRLHGVARPIAQEVFRQVAAFVGYGFCRSHAAAFARTVYQSAYLKRHFPAAYIAAVLQHLPGFFPQHTILEEARKMGVKLLPVCIFRSKAKYTLENGAIRLPLVQVSEISPETAQQLEQAIMGRAPKGTRASSSPSMRIVKPVGAEQIQTEVETTSVTYPAVSGGDFSSFLVEIQQAVALDLTQWEALARAGAFDLFSTNRRDILWRLGLGPAGASRMAKPVGAERIQAYSGTSSGTYPAVSGGIRVAPCNFGQTEDRSRGKGVRKPAKVAARLKPQQLSLFSVFANAESDVADLAQVRLEQVAASTAKAEPVSVKPSDPVRNISCDSTKATSIQPTGAEPIQGKPSDSVRNLPCGSTTPGTFFLQSGEQRQAWDFETQRLSVQAHPIQAYRGQLGVLGVSSVKQLQQQPSGTWAKLAGWVLVRQRPPTAKGMMFLMIEDETGRLQIAVTPDQVVRWERILLRHNSLLVAGPLEAPSPQSRYRSLRLQEAHPIQMLEGVVTILQS
jgi:error-prone DNA polymerase